MERIAKMDRTSPEIIRQVESILEKKFESVLAVDLLEVGGVNYIAEIMNKIDRSTEKFIFDELGKKDAKLAEEIRKRMFVFEDIVTLDSFSIQKFLREVDTRDLAIALKGANKEVSAVIFQNIPAYGGNRTERDRYLHNVRVRDVDEAQQKIVAIIRRLEEEGEVVITKGGKDDIIV